MNLVQMRRDDDPPKGAIQPLRQSNVRVVKLHDRKEHHFIERKLLELHPEERQQWQAKDR